jgi:DNA-binding response OmpR family regulator
MTQPAHIVVVEDDAPLRALLTRLLGEHGYDATGVCDGAALSQIIMHPDDRPVDLILLVIMVSARGQESDRVAGLDCGADDYVPKPFSRLELLARIRAALRRGRENCIPAEIATPECYRFEGWQFFPRRRELIAPSGAQVSLTAAEHELLLVLLRHAQRTISRERLMELVHSRLSHSGDRSIDVLVSRLRGKLGGDRRALPLIRTVRGVGYVFCAELDVHPD